MKERLCEVAENEVEKWRSAERELSDAYLRLRALIPGAFDTPRGPSTEQMWAHTEACLKAALAGKPKPERSRMWTVFKRGDWVVIDNAPGAIIQTDNPRLDVNGVLLVVYVSENTSGVEVTDASGIHGVVDRMSLRHTPFASAK